MKRIAVFIAALLVLTTLGLTVLVQAGDLAQVQSATIPEVSTEYEVPITLEDPTAALKLSNSTLQLTYKTTKKLTASEKDVVWSSSNEKVVRVGSDGTLTAAGRGTATVTAAAKDGRTASCTVTVRYTVWQWIIRILLFGWIWY